MPSTKHFRVSPVAPIFAALFLFLPAIVRAQTTAKNTVAAAGTAEQRAARAYEAARANPLDLEAFLVRMPKGADLHYHLTGGIYAETFIRDAAEDGLCVDLASPCTWWRPSPSCGAGQVAAAKAFSDQNLYDALINAFSMRSFVPSPGVSGHDHFFDTFGQISRHRATATAANGSTKSHRARPRRTSSTWNSWRRPSSATRSRSRRKSDGATISRSFATRCWRADCAMTLPWPAPRGMKPKLPAARSSIAARPQEAPGCKITIRYLYQVLRGFPKEQVFAQTLLGFEVASADPRFVGINYVMPEDGTISMADYALHMKIVGFLHGLYPKVHISLHAGELAPGLVPPEGLCCHIRLAVEDAHAERIGHGVDVMYEDRPYDLLKEMAAKHVMVEINLTSNDVILGVAGKDHPLPIYRKFHVPVALSTDDEGVSRIDLTHEYVRAAETYALSYADLKQMVRTGLEHDFLPGASLWREPDVFTRAVRRVRARRARRCQTIRSLRRLPQVQRKSAAAMGTRAALPRI